MIHCVMLIDDDNGVMSVIETDTKVRCPGTTHLAEEPKILCNDFLHTVHMQRLTPVRCMRSI